MRKSGNYQVSLRRYSWIATCQLFLLTSLLFLVSLCYGQSTTYDLGLTQQEVEWMEAHPVIKVAPDPDFPPVEFIDEKGSYSGIAADYLQIIEAILPVTFELVIYPTWSEVLDKIKQHDVDMLGGATPTPARLQYLRFTQPYVHYPVVVLVRDAEADFPKLSELTGKTVAVVADYVEHEHVNRVYPNIPLEVVPNISSGLRQVSFGQIDAMVLNLASASYYIQKHGITNLKITEDIEVITDISYAVRSDWPELAAILNKTIEAIDESKKKGIINKWIAVTNKSWQPSPFFILSCLAGLLLAGMLGILYWNRMLQRQVEDRTARLSNELHGRLELEKEKNRLQQQVFRAKKMEALGLLAGGVAHDLNNILTGTVGYSELAMSQVEEGEQLHNYLKEIRNSGKRAGLVVADLLTISRDTATNRAVVDVNDLLREYAHSPEQLAIEGKFPKVSFRFTYSDDLTDISCSVVHVKKSIMNLLLNGAEATKKGTVELQTEKIIKRKPASQDSQEDNESTYVKISVTDDGPGISPEDMERIFEPFYSKKKLGHSGTGLGLAIVWNTVEEHGGWIDVVQLDQGTRFELYFPTTEQERTANEVKYENMDLEGNGEFILVVDDEKQVRDLASRHLENLGYRTAVVSSGEEAICFLKENSVDLLILDMIMEPGLNGYQTYKEITKEYPGQKAIITSGFSENREVKRTQQLGAGEYIMKPYTVVELGVAVKKELQFSL